MSYVNIVIAKDDRIYFVSLPRRSAQKFVDNFEHLLSSLNSNFLDSGFVMIDANRKVILNSQSAFHLKKEGYDVYEA